MLPYDAADYQARLETMRDFDAESVAEVFDQMLARVLNRRSEQAR